MDLGLEVAVVEAMFGDRDIRNLQDLARIFRIRQQSVWPEAVLEASPRSAAWRVLARGVPLDLPHPQQQQRLRGQLRHHPRELQQQYQLRPGQGHHSSPQPQEHKVCIKHKSFYVN